MRKATICFLIKKDHILLGMKKRGFGAGLWNGAGGKVHEADGESILQGAMRETQEEFGVTMLDIRPVAELTFINNEIPEQNQLVYVYTCNTWTGKPTESEEMKPRWFSTGRIPYKKMWADDPLWLPYVLEGKFIKATFQFNRENKIVDKAITLI